MECNVITCPEDCSATLPVVNFNECAPQTNDGEVIYLAVTKTTAIDFTDIEDIAEWNTRVSQTALTADSIRLIPVIGDKPAPEEVVKTISLRREIVSSRTHSINFDIDETNDENYNFINQTTCGGQYKVWYVTADGRVYGGNCGLTGSLKINPVHTRGKGENLLFQGTFKFELKNHPARNTFPLAI
jgi:hypothetical protein